MQILRRDGFKPSVWKNGGGRTHEVFRAPAEGEPLRWRFSLAEVDRSGPFSDFTGYQRLLILLDGGFALRFANGDYRKLSGVGDLVQFDGALGVECELAGRTSTDLNLIASKAIAGVRARVVSLAAPLAVHLVPGATLVVFAVAGAVTVSWQDAGGGAAAASAALATTAATAELATWDAAIGVAASARVVRLATAPVGAPAQVFFAEFSDTAA